MKTMHCTISGLVQGVGFRYFTLQHARTLGLRGWAKNLSNGDVEVVAQGDDAALEQFRGELRSGPRSAQVRKIRVDWKEDAEMYNTFEIR